uniref:LisH domain-containing protein n=1 Tax=Lotharella globosa TaxID=91324 RepID=A0A7S3YHZ5_9EUKA
MDATREGVGIVLQFLHEQGFISARKALEVESGIEYDEKTQGAHKGNYLLSAVAVYNEFLLSKTPESGKAEKERAIEEDLVNPKGGPTKPVSTGKKLAAVHGVNIIDVRFSYAKDFQDIVASSDAKGSIVVTDVKSGSTRTAVKPGFFKAPSYVAT